MYRFNAVVFGVGLLLLQSCSTTMPPMSADELEQRWVQRQQRLSTLESWQLRGRIGFVSERESGSGSLYWQQQESVYQLKVVAPLGRGAINIIGDADSVKFQTDKGEQHHSADVEKLIWQRTGWVIPVHRLRYWVLGLPADNSTEQYQLDQSGRLVSLQSDIWRVEYKRYRDAGEFELPAKVVVHGPDVKIKVSVSEWSTQQ